MYEDLIVSAIPRAKTVARKYRGSLDRDEAVSIALLTLVEIAPRFNPARGVKFTTFASRRIIGAIQDAQRENGGLLAVPRGMTVEYFQKTEGRPISNRHQRDFRVLDQAVKGLSKWHRIIILTFAAESTGRGSHCQPAETPQHTLGMNEATFHWYRRRILAQLRIALEARGVRKVSDIL